MQLQTTYYKFFIKPAAMFGVSIQTSSIKRIFYVSLNVNTAESITILEALLRAVVGFICTLLCTLGCSICVRLPPRLVCSSGISRVISHILHSRHSYVANSRTTFYLYPGPPFHRDIGGSMHLYFQSHKPFSLVVACSAHIPSTFASIKPSSRRESLGTSAAACM